jgi:hypothetical protein
MDGAVIVPSAFGSSPSTIAATAQASADAQFAARTVAVRLELGVPLELAAATGRPVRGSIGERPGRQVDVATASPAARSISCDCP